MEVETVVGRPTGVGVLGFDFLAFEDSAFFPLLRLSTMFSFLFVGDVPPPPPAFPFALPLAITFDLLPLGPPLTTALLPPLPPPVLLPLPRFDPVPPLMGNATTVNGITFPLLGTRNGLEAGAYPVPSAPKPRRV